MTLGKRQNHEKSVLDSIYTVFIDLSRAMENWVNRFRPAFTSKNLNDTGLLINRMSPVQFGSLAFLTFSEDDYGDYPLDYSDKNHLHVTRFPFFFVIKRLMIKRDFVRIS